MKFYKLLPNCRERERVEEQERKRERDIENLNKERIKRKKKDRVKRDKRMKCQNLNWNKLIKVMVSFGVMLFYKEN